MSTEGLQQIERAFLCSPRQPRRPLPSEFPPTPASSSPHSRRVKRLLLSAMTPTQNSWRKQKRIREQKKNELIEDEAAARTILMLSSSLPSSSSTTRQQHTAAFAPTPSSSLPPHDTAKNSTSSAESVSSQEESIETPSSLHMYKNFEQPHPADDIFDAVSKVPNYEERSRYIGQALRQSHNENTDRDYQHRLQPPPPPAISDDHGQIQHNRPLPPPHLHNRYPPTSMQYKLPSPPMFGRPLSEDPFNSKPIIHEDASSYRHSRSPPSLP
ncbi:60S ribosomal protein L24 [Mucor velutinosus]|uniref:60S ribosomal protein L24 n=1 Tax=Mucor velutinosus TaxID=708070 RepID=A0AAN7I4R4_9FUNG|nr:60S ribosomal protein L24 [Mucor velutinosus]